MNRKRIFRELTIKGLVSMAFLGISAAAPAEQLGIRITPGMGNHGIHALDLGLIWDPDVNWWKMGDWHFSLVGEAHVSYWHARSNNYRDIYALGLMPVVRFIKSSGEIRPYIEAGAGVELLSHASLSNSYTLSSAFQFSEVIGVGAQFGHRQQYQVGLRFQHISNAGIREPNPGINFGLAYFQYNF